MEESRGRDVEGADGMSRPVVLGVPIDPVTMPELLAELREGIEASRREWVVTVNNEILVRASRQAEYRDLINTATKRVADSAGVVWAAHFGKHPGGYLRAYGQLLRMAVFPRTVRSEIPGTIPGSELTVELAAMAEEFAYPVLLLGAGPGVAEAAAAELKRRFPRLKIAAALAGSPSPQDDQPLQSLIRESAARIILVAYGPPKQDQWIGRNLASLPTGVVAVGVGGTFDYLAGAASIEGGRPAKQPPTWVRQRGFEWLWRLLTQPSRWRRILTAVPVYVGLVVRSRRS
jgi:N-acetylglucosaminyldiphosphoundecaprenol N-acetyl-beta-D-mannosaminyltransferase